ncbi:hypothetical protein BH20ACT9_BH20ACT9_06770 [soil metagenome]
MTKVSIGEMLTRARRWLHDRPDAAHTADTGVTAVLDSGLCIRATDDGGKTLVTDMPPRSAHDLVDRASARSPLLSALHRDVPVRGEIHTVGGQAAATP